MIILPYNKYIQTLAIGQTRRCKYDDQRGVELFKQHQKGNVTKNTLRSYGRFLEQLQARFSEKEVVSVSPDDIGAFLDDCTEGLGRSTHHFRYSQIKAFFNYIIEATGLNIKSPCNTASLSKTFKIAQYRPRQILDKETVDKIIFKSENTKDRPILELRARCRLRIGEVLNLHAADIHGRKLIIQELKSGRDEEIAFMQNTSQFGRLSMSPVRNSHLVIVPWITDRNVTTWMAYRFHPGSHIKATDLL